MTKKFSLTDCVHSHWLLLISGILLSHIGMMPAQHACGPYPILCFTCVQLNKVLLLLLLTIQTRLYVGVKRRQDRTYYRVTRRWSQLACIVKTSRRNWRK